MDHRIPKTRLIVGIVCGVLALITFIYLNLAFEGPSVLRSLGGERHEYVAIFDDTEVLPTKQPVLLRGLEVGKIRAVEYNHDDATATVEFTLDDDYVPIYKDASAIIGERTVLGDPYMALDPGTEAAGELSDDGGEVEALASVDFDEALDFLDEEGRVHTRSILDELRVATRSDRGAEQLNQSVGELTRVTTELRTLTRALSGQEEDIAGLVADASTVFSELGSREAAIRTLVASGRVTLDALAANTTSLAEGLRQTPPLLDEGRQVLALARPLIESAGPLVRELDRAAPKLSPILAELPSLSADTVEIVSELSGIPTLRKLLDVVSFVGPAVPELEAAARNVVALLQFSAKHRKGTASFFANLADSGSSGDVNGNWLRTAAIFEPAFILDEEIPATCFPEDDVAPNGGVCSNAYPEPGDALDNEPFEPGSYERIEPFDPFDP